MEGKRLEMLMKLSYVSKEGWISDKKKDNDDEDERRRKGKDERNKVERKDRRMDSGKKMKRREGMCFAGEEFDAVRSRHSKREGGGTSARWRWRVGCLAPDCPRRGASYDKADRLIHHLTRQPSCANFWRKKIGSRLDDVLRPK